MAGISFDEFEARVTTICSTSSAIESVSVIRMGFTWLKIRAYLINDSFIDMTYNQETGKTTFAQIRENRRIFGADNKKAWHWHPYEDPQRHEFTNREITFAEFLKRVEENLSK